MNANIVVGLAASLPKAAAIYAGGISALVSTGSPDASSLFAVSLELLEKNGAVVVVVVDSDDKFLSGLHVVTDGEGNGVIQGVGTAPHARGNGYGRLIVLTALDLLAKQGVAQVELYVRCDDHAAPYPAPFKLYQGCGFVADPTTSPVEISGTELDRHLGPAGGKFLVQRMTRKLY